MGQTLNVFGPRISGEELASVGAGHPFVYRRESEIRHAPKLGVLVGHKTYLGARQDTFTSTQKGAHTWSGST